MHLLSSVSVLLVSDIELARLFYQTVLSCHEVDGILFRRDCGLAIKLVQAEKIEDVKPNRNLWNVFSYVEDEERLDKLFHEAKAHGALFAYYPKIREIGDEKLKEFAIRDLDGYLIGFGLAIER
ncbi:MULTISPECIES: VOC family protein [unclassified Rummeliibacillus]|uniref:VOC family protein n=1 Tax=unclassified Rummeliibacillus TaxID=2622809 RepID=UPI000E672076|nr:MULTISPECIES: VOC family protein [unclassified Rummeliibacillus]RIJ63949.1 VOC family protein [Rummeliibacillus sp. POC4]RPJ95457.1 VOC family protein [Rummeliibacillus sp. TYF005]